MKKLYQYVLGVSCGDIMIMMKEICKIMYLNFDAKKADLAVDSPKKYSLESVYITRDENLSERFVLMDCTSEGDFYSISVQTTDKDHLKIKSELSKLCIRIKNQYHISDNAEEGIFIDVYNTEEDGYMSLLKTLKIDYI